MDIIKSTLHLLDPDGIGQMLFAEVDPNSCNINLEAGVKAY